MKAFWHDAQRAHAPRTFIQRGQVRAHLETQARADALLEGCRTAGLAIAPPPEVTRADLLAVHAADYLDFLRDAPAAWAAMPDAGPEVIASTHAGPEMQMARAPAGIAGLAGWYMADTSCPIMPETWQAALWAAAGAIAASDEVAAGRSAYALARPPGHHAYPARAGGHCYLNNAALAADRLRARGAACVAVLDIDAHHGNGTQHIFWSRADVTFASIHGDPDHYYPWYVGRADERGAGAGLGHTLNLPLPAGTGDAAWLDAIGHALRAVAHADALVVSLGFDPSEHEPLRFLAVSDDGFARAGAAIRGAERPAAIIQEGGYAVEALPRLLTRFLDGFGGGV